MSARTLLYRLGMAAMLMLPLHVQTGAAQGLGLSKDSDEPVEINADQGIEWRRDDQVYVARGNATAKRGSLPKIRSPDALSESSVVVSTVL